jgi:hypothetical protein
MLRLFVFLLLLANGVYFAWSQGYLSSLGLLPHKPGEAQRLQNQIKPEAIRLLNVTEARRVEQLAVTPTQTPTQAPTQAAIAPQAAECLQTALLDAKQVNAVRAAASSLPEGSWRVEDASTPARWIVYMGKYTDAAALTKKKSELRELSVAFEPVRVASLEPGISLGAFESQREANEEMVALTRRGVRTAKVVQESAARNGQRLTLPQVDDVLRTQLDGIRSALGAAALQSCKT